MPSFGGYGKPMGLYMAAALVPMLLGEILAFAFIQYFFYFFIGGIVAMFNAFLAVMSYSASANRGVRQIAADVQYPDGTQEYTPIRYREAIIDLGREQVKDKTDQYRYRYALTALDGNEWLLMFDHPLAQLTPSMDDAPIGAVIATIPTQKGTFIPMRYIEEPLATLEIKHIGIFARRILRRKPRTLKEVREMYCSQSAANVKAYKDKLLRDFADQKKRPPTSEEDQALNKDLIKLGAAFPTPTAEEVHSMYSAWVDYKHKEDATEKDQYKDHFEKVQDMLDNHLPITLETSPTKISEGKVPWEAIAKWGAIAGIVIGVLLLVLHALGSV